MNYFQCKIFDKKVSYGNSISYKKAKKSLGKYSLQNSMIEFTPPKRTLNNNSGTRLVIGFIQ